MRIFSMRSGLFDSMERRERTSFSIFPLSSMRRWCSFIQAFCKMASLGYNLRNTSRYSGPIHFHIENRNRLGGDSGKIQLDRVIDLLALALTLRDILSNGFYGSLHRLGSHVQHCQNFHMFAAMIEWSILAH